MGIFKRSLESQTEKMNKNTMRPEFKKQIKIKGPVLFLIGPIGTFFARLSKYLEKRNIKTYKISFPLFEYGFPRDRRIIFNKDIVHFKSFLHDILIEKEIKHILMYGNVLIPHRDALELIDDLNKDGRDIQSHIFELGYFRPNFVTLEEKGVNYKSGFILSKEFYNKQKPFKEFPLAIKQNLRLRKIWKAITFINHSFQNYKIVDCEHKLQPKPSYLWFQIKGFFLKYAYFFTEYKIKKDCFFKSNFFIVILQVSSDSQLTKGSNIKNNYNFIESVIIDFYNSGLKDTKLVFKHHPRDRGYNNYLSFIRKLSKNFDLTGRVYYIHDYRLSKIFRNNKCKGTVLVNSTVGYQSLFHSVPVKSLGKTPYNFDGLSDQRDLVCFFKNPQKVNNQLFSKFYRYIMENSQINGNFDGFFPFDELFKFD